MNVAIIGTGYVGLTTGVCLAYLGHEVTCLDTDQRKIDLLRGGRTPIYEPYLPELLAQARERLHFSTSYAEGIPEAEVVFIAVGTPPGPDGNPYLGYLESAAVSVGAHISHSFTVVVNKSTVPIGSGNWVESLIRESLEKREDGVPATSFAMASNPEFLREGSALHDSLYPDRIVIGADTPRALELLYTLYRPVLDQSFAEPPFLPRPDYVSAVPLVSTGLASAELVKYAANAFLALKISFINEIAQLSEKVGANVSQVAKGIGLDRRIGERFLQAGIGWGGSCFGKDTAALIGTGREYGLEMPIVEAARTVNQRQRDRVVEKLLDELKILKGRTIAMLGLAFKPNTDDVRDAPAVDLASRLIARGCRVKAHDPVAVEAFQRDHPDLKIQCCPEPMDAVSGADALVLVTEWPQYRELDWPALAAAMRSAVVVDGRNFQEGAQWRQFGFNYLGLGR